MGIRWGVRKDGWMDGCGIVREERVRVVRLAERPWGC
jgi:hypothetical protein